MHQRLNSVIWRQYIKFKVKQLTLIKTQKSVDIYSTLIKIVTYSDCSTDFNVFVKVKLKFSVIYFWFDQCSVSNKAVSSCTLF